MAADRDTPRGARERALEAKGICPSCELPALLVDDGQGFGLLICENCKAVADILDRTPFWKWPGNDLPPAEAMRQPLKDWMRLCHRELLGKVQI